MYESIEALGDRIHRLMRDHHYLEAASQIERMSDYQEFDPEYLTRLADDLKNGRLNTFSGGNNQHIGKHGYILQVVGSIERTIVFGCMCSN